MEMLTHETMNIRQPTCLPCQTTEVQLPYETSHNNAQATRVNWVKLQATKSNGRNNWKFQRLKHTVLSWDLSILSWFILFNVATLSQIENREGKDTLYIMCDFEGERGSERERERERERWLKVKKKERMGEGRERWFQRKKVGGRERERGRERNDKRKKEREIYGFERKKKRHTQTHTHRYKNREKKSELTFWDLTPLRFWTSRLTLCILRRTRHGRCRCEPGHSTTPSGSTRHQRRRSQTAGRTTTISTHRWVPLYSK